MERVLTEKSCLDRHSIGFCSIVETSLDFVSTGKESNYFEYRVHCSKGTSINDVPPFLAIFDLPTLSYSITSNFWGYLGPSYLSTLISDVINGLSLVLMNTYDLYLRTCIILVCTNNWYVCIYF